LTRIRFSLPTFFSLCILPLLPTCSAMPLIPSRSVRTHRSPASPSQLCFFARMV